MTTWKLTIHPECEKGLDPFNVCRQKRMVGIGWAGVYDAEIPRTIDEAKLLFKKKFDQDSKNWPTKWPPAVQKLLEEVKSGDHIWLHQDGHFFLCVIASEKLYFADQIDEDFIRYDLGHAREAHWLLVPERYVSGRIQRGTIAQRIIQRIHVTEYEEQINQYLFSHLTENPSWTPEISDAKVANTLTVIPPNALAEILTPDDYEDTVAHMLQDTGWHIVKSSCFRSKPKFEFVMKTKQGKVAHVQVKSGNVALRPTEYRDWVDTGDDVFLFSAAEIPFVGEDLIGVHKLLKSEMIEWMKSNLWALSDNLKLRICLWTDF